MPELEWFKRKPGQAPVSENDPAMSLHQKTSVGNWTRVPPELGGGIREIVHQVMRECPIEPSHGVGRMFILDGEEIVAIECVTCGKFYWGYVQKEDRSGEAV